tara:strand:+ start:521 stop:784 length:264 start_codon:yes stop_codon:yes gene_type:complete
MFNGLRIWLWGLSAELEYKLYPWKTSTPPQWVKERYMIDDGAIFNDHEFDDNDLHYDWLKSHDDKIDRLQNEMVYVYEQLNLLDKKQ